MIVPPNRLRDWFPAAANVAAAVFLGLLALARLTRCLQ